MSKKRVAELDTPFSAVEWPAVSQEDLDSILELLCTLLAPLGQHQRDHVPPSKGKRSHRRRRQTPQGPVPARDPESVRLAAALPKPNMPPPPELAAYVDVGLAKITRTLSASACRPALPTDAPAAAPYTVIFVVRSGHPSIFYSHFPQMVAVASRGCAVPSGSSSDAPTDASAMEVQPPSREPIRLVGFSRACEDRLGNCLGIPHVSSIALRPGAMQSQGLLDFVRSRVPPVVVPWLQEAQTGEHRQTRIHMAEIRIGPKKKKA